MGERSDYKRKYYQENREKILEYDRKRYQKNREKILECERKYRQKNKDKINERKKRWIKNTREKNPRYRLKMNIRVLISSRLKRRLLCKGGRSTFSFLPYTADDLKSHLESLFEPWMSWDNYGKEKGCWSIDHIIPESSFKYNSVNDEEFQKCWTLENLRPLDHCENIKKGNKIINY